MTSTAIVLTELSYKASQINACHRATLAAGQTMLARARAAGRYLLEVKASLPHGEFGDWCRENLTFGEHTARRYMKLAKSSMHARFDPEASINAALDAIAAKQEPKEGTRDSLDRDTAERLVKLSRLANSPNVNEAAVAQEMLDKIGKKFGMTGEEAEVAAKKLCPEPPSHDELVQRAAEFNARIAGRLEAIRSEVDEILSHHSRAEAASHLAQIICVLKFPKEFKNA